ncbi:UNVERIFIED_CONTAM: Subtilisin-like protease SBT3 [Sesamum angustifolium]|uniref:Subtilisin-like protease SBT3 n=1 Tax=Sesamum angustifolium TaxID=2727405 RepID=A0AAW2LFV3_9LAMI
MPKANFKFQETGLSTKPTPNLASYSSRGPSQSCPFILKLDSMAPAALLKGAHPDWSPAAIRSAVMTATNVLDNTKSPIKDTRSNNKPVTPLAMGASHIDPNKALDPGLIYDASSEDYINLLCALNFTTKHIQAITRLTSYNCKNPSLNLNCPSFITYFYAKDTNSDSTKEQEF